MLEFPSQDGIEIYASNSGFICFSADGLASGMDAQTVCISIGQFRSVIKHANELIANAEANKALAKEKYNAE